MSIPLEYLQGLGPVMVVTSIGFSPFSNSRGVASWRTQVVESQITQHPEIGVAPAGPHRADPLDDALADACIERA